MARQRVRAQMTWDSARRARKALIEKLAKKAVASAGANAAEGYNSTDHWQDVGKYRLLDEILWECDK